MSADGLEELSHGQLVDRVRELAHGLATAIAQQGQLSEALKRAEQDCDTAVSQSRQAQVSLEREAAKNAQLRDELAAGRGRHDTAMAQVRAALAAGADDRTEAQALRANLKMSEDANRQLRGRLLAARQHVAAALGEIGE